MRLTILAALLAVACKPVSSLHLPESGDPASPVVPHLDGGARGMPSGSAPTFEQSTISGTSYIPWASSIAVVDLDGNGALDLVTANRGDLLGDPNHQSVGVLLANADGTFQPEVKYAEPFDVQTVATGDFDGDGKPDVVVDSTAIDVRLNTGLGVLGPSRQGGLTQTGFTTPVGLAVLDVNGDGKLDIANCRQSSGGCNVLPGNGDGTFGGPIPVIAEEMLAAGDFNEDGRGDIVTFASSGVAIELGQSDGTLLPSDHGPIPSLPHGLTVGDLDGDGHLDAVVSCGGAVVVATGDGHGGFRALTQVDEGPWPSLMSIGDFNGDGYADLIVFEEMSLSLNFHAGGRNGSLSPPVAVVSGFPSNMSALAAGDFDRDGKLDLAVSYTTPNLGPTLFILFNRTP
jgi:hypothetical protein